MAPPRGNSPGSTGTSGRRLTRRTLLAGAASLAAAGTLGATATACSRVPATEGAGGDLLKQLKAQGHVKIGIAGEQPYSFIGEDGRLDGYEPAIARTIFERLGVPHIQALPTEFNSLIAGLNSRQFDVIAAGMYINEKRCAQVLFADPDYRMGDAFIVRKGNEMGLHTYEDIVRTGAVLATGTGYAEIKTAKEAGVKKSKLLLLGSQLDGLQAVSQKRADAFAGTAVTVRYVVRNAGDSGVEATGEIVPMRNGRPRLGTGAFAFRPTETALCDAFNHELRKMKKDGELLRIMRPFGFLRKEMTYATAKERCQLS